MRFILLFLTFFSSFAVQVFSGDTSISFENFFSVDRLGTPVVSPDGKLVAFTVKKANISENSYLTQIWMIGQNGENLRQLTTDSLSSVNPVFSPDSKFIYYLTPRSGSMQIWQLPVDGGEAKQITKLYDGVEEFVISPTNDHLLMVRKVPPECKTEDCIKEKGKDKNMSIVKARIIDRLMYRHWNEWMEGKYSHLFLISTNGTNAMDITPGTYHAPPLALGSSHDYSFSPDGTEICYVSNHEEEIAISTNNDLFVYSLKKETTQKISTSMGNDNNPQYSPDGKYIAYSSMERAGFEADRQRLTIYNRTNQKTTELTAGFMLSIGDILWSPDSKSIYFTTEEKGNISVYHIALETKRIVPVFKGHYVKGIKFIDNNTLIFSKQSSRMPYEIYTYDLDKKKLHPLTHFNNDHLAKFSLPGFEEFWFRGAQGDSIHGFIMKPPQYEAGKKYPAVHLIHGGPQGMWSNDWHYRWNYQMFASPGYVVYYINFHGSTGYGQKFTDSISRHWGDLPYEDLVIGTEYVLKNYDYIDSDRLAAAGASYGGFMVNWIAGHENPYQCLISHDGTYDQKSMWGSTEELWFPEWEMGGTPWQEGTDYDKWSPARLAANFKTPTLIIHGEHDYRLPYTQGLQYFSALQRQKVPSRLLFFPDEDHWVQKPQNAQLWWKTVHEWLEKYLKD